MSASTRLRQLADAAEREYVAEETRYCMACGSSYGVALDAFRRVVDSREFARWCADAADWLELKAHEFGTARELVEALNEIVAGGGSTP